MPDVFELAVSATTRERRPSERHGREYYFLGEREFDSLLEKDEFLEYVELPLEAFKLARQLRAAEQRHAAQAAEPLAQPQLVLARRH